METTDNRTPAPKQHVVREFMRSHTARFLLTGIIVAILLIPLTSLKFLIQERKQRQRTVEQEIASQWGPDATSYGAVIVVPVTGPDKQVTPGFLYPENDASTVQLHVSKKHRGIFMVPTFNAHMKGKYVFHPEQLQLPKGHTVNWNQAQVAVVTTLGNRFRRIAPVIANGKPLLITEQRSLHSDKERLQLHLTTPFTINPSTLQITTDISLNGSTSIRYLPTATQSTLRMESNWKHPSFQGQLPDPENVTITSGGFSGKWNSMRISADNQSFHIGSISVSQEHAAEVRLIQPVDQYQLNERTLKYALLVLILTFAVFILIQFAGKFTIHPLHYLMIGLALMLFYSLLLSFSEHIGFIRSYLLASVAIVSLITWYARSVLRSVRFALTAGLSLSLLYAFLLVMVNLEIYALIVGSIGLLIVLTGIMSVTRKLSFETT